MVLEKSLNFLWKRDIRTLKLFFLNMPMIPLFFRLPLGTATRLPT